MSAQPSTRASLPDLNRLAGDLRSAWHALLASPAFTRVGPAHRVRLIRPDRSVTHWQARGAVIRQAPDAPAEAEFTALELPEERVLLRTLRMPPIEGDALTRALALEAATSSPFPADDLCWGWQARAGQAGPARHWEVALALASRAQIRQFLEETRAAVTADPPEVWALQPGYDPIVLPGFGEARRLSRAAAGQRLVMGLGALVLVLLAAIAVTPAVQQRQRALAAVDAMDTLVRRAEPATRQRAQLVQALDQATALAERVARSPQPLRVLNLLTQTLPDDTSVLSLQVDGAKVTVNGMTGDAAALMQLLSTRAEFKDVKAPTPATRPLGSNKDLFTIELTMADPARVSDALPGTAVAPAATGGVAVATAPAASAAAPGNPGGATAPAPAAAPAPGGATFGGATFGGGPVRKP